MTDLNQTHAQDLSSWVESANSSDTDFPIQNLPYGCYLDGDRQSIGIAIGNQVLDLQTASATKAAASLSGDLKSAMSADTLNLLMSLERAEWQVLRSWASAALSADAEDQVVEELKSCLLDQSAVAMLLPATIGDYTDFYASVYHATNVGSLFRPDNPLLPNYKHIPIGYHGRSSTVVPSGTAIRRPKGQTKGPDDEVPSYGPCRLLDYELEVGLWVGGPTNSMGETVDIDDAEDRLFGLCLLNDWSARDLQAWEYVPLGPFLAKSFATSVSPWVVTFEALAPFRCEEFQRDEGDPQPLPYLQAKRDKPGLEFTVQTFLASEAMRSATEGEREQKLSETTVANLYWTPAQMVTHHSSNGCSLNAGDLLGTGTVSGPESDELGSLLEITRRGQNPLELVDGTERKMLQDADEVILRGFAEAPGARRIGFGECRGVVLPVED